MLGFTKQCRLAKVGLYTHFKCEQNLSAVLSGLTLLVCVAVYYVRNLCIFGELRVKIAAILPLHTGSNKDIRK